MRAKWRKIIWAILAVQLFLLHFLFLERNDWLDFLVYRAVRHFGLPSFLMDRWKQLAAIVWLATAGAFLLLHYFAYRQFRGRCVRSLEQVREESVRQAFREAAEETGIGTGGIWSLAERAGLGAGGFRSGRERAFLYCSEEVQEPFVMGFLTPILLLPKQEYGGRVLKFIFLHECWHIRHRDTVYKLFLLVMQSLLWFQPLMYLLAALGSRDVEVACDEAVVEGRDMDARREYGLALLDCVRRGQGKWHSAYFGSFCRHGRRVMEARIAAIMKEDRKWDALAYIAIAVLLLEAGLGLYRVGEGMYARWHVEEQEPLIYEGYEIPDSFTQSAVDGMAGLAPVGEDSYFEGLRAENAFPEKEYDRLPYAAEGPWQIRLKDADYYANAVPLLLQRYLSWHLDWEWATQWDPEASAYTLLDSVYDRMLAGDRQEAVFAVIFRYYVGSWEEMQQFPRELADRARFAFEDGACYAYFDWAVHISMVRDYVFQLEGIAQLEPVLEALEERCAQADFSDVPALDLVHEMPSTGKYGLGEAYQTDIRDGVLWVSGGDGVMREVPVPLEDILCRGDQMEGQLTSLQPGSYQVDERKQIFAYGGDYAVPFSVVYYDEDSGSFCRLVVTGAYFGGRRIFVDFPENGQEGFLIFTGERVVWQESTILFTTSDGGATWQEVGCAGPDVSREGHSLTTGAKFLSNQVGFLTIRDSEVPHIWRTQDGGRSWERQTLPQVPQGYSMAYPPERRGDALALYVGMEDYSEYGGKKAKYESVDEGKTWEYRGFVIRR